MEETRAYEELRVGFTAAVSHELRTPLARLLALLDTAALPDVDRDALLAQAREQVEEMRELVDDVLFLSELESGREVVALGNTPARPVLEEVRDRLADSAERADVAVRIEGPTDATVPLRRRMVQIVAENLVANAIRHAGPGSTLTLTVGPGLLEAADDGRGVEQEELPRLFERFFRSDRARASRGTGLGLAIVKHVVTAAGGEVEATGGPGHGLTIRCLFSTSAPGRAS
ncbi:MAG TPA: ATP-binding protein [Gaiellaceae bacterium]|nr:ATP-binding protein [Gaiellaceae bacterium]